MVHPGPSASIAGNKLSVRTTAEELNRRKATVYIHPIFAPCRLNIQPGVRINLLEFPFGSTRKTLSTALIDVSLVVPAVSLKSRPSS